MKGGPLKRTLVLSLVVVGITAAMPAASPSLICFDAGAGICG